MKKLGLAACAASFALSGAAQAATQCFDSTGTFGAVSVTVSGTGCIQNAGYSGQPTLGNTTTGGACILTFSKPLATSSFVIDVSVINGGDVNAFVLDGGTYALQPADVSASPVFADPNVATASGGQLLYSGGGVGTAGARVVFGAAAPASVTTLEISQIDAGGSGSPYRICADDADVVLAPVAVPTMTEWAMILFGTILAGGTALYLQRRRQVF